MTHVTSSWVQAHLKRILDETSLGQYDFVYLRIGKPFGLGATTDANSTPDFFNNCKCVEPMMTCLEAD
jgi:hypothetical protein